MSCPHCKHLAITGMLHGCTIITQYQSDHRAKPSDSRYFPNESPAVDRELSTLIDSASEGVEY